MRRKDLKEDLRGSSYLQIPVSICFRLFIDAGMNMLYWLGTRRITWVRSAISYRIRHSGSRYYSEEGQCGDDVRRIFHARDLAAVQERFRVCQVGFRHYFGGNSLSAGADLPFRHSRRAGGDDPGSTHGRAYRSFPDAFTGMTGRGMEVRAAAKNGQKYRHHHCPRVWKRWASVGGNVGAKAGNQTL